MEEKEVVRIGRNRIVDDGFNFYINYIGTKESTNVRWTLDHDERAIDYLIEDIKRNGVFPARGCRKGGANIIAMFKNISSSKQLLTGGV